MVYYNGSVQLADKLKTAGFCDRKILLERLISRLISSSEHITNTFWKPSLLRKVFYILFLLWLYQIDTI